jgi:hypothetical protein
MSVRKRVFKKNLFAVILLLILPLKGFACINLYDNSITQQTCYDVAVPMNGPPTHYKASELKSRSTARMYSAVFTTVPIGLSRFASNGWQLSDQSITSMFLIASGAIFGPSAGSIYAEDWGIIRNGVISRSLSMSLIVTGSILNEKHSNDNHLSSLGRVFQISGLVFFAGSALYDAIIVSAHSVDYYNASIRMGVGTSAVSKFHDEWNIYPDFRVQFFF